MQRQLIKLFAIIFFIVVSIPICLITYSTAMILYYLFKIYQFLKLKK